MEKSLQASLFFFCGLARAAFIFCFFFFFFFSRFFSFFLSFRLWDGAKGPPGLLPSPCWASRNYTPFFFFFSLLYPPLKERAGAKPQAGQSACTRTASGADYRTCAGHEDSKQYNYTPLPRSLLSHAHLHGKPWLDVLNMQQAADKQMRSRACAQMTPHKTSCRLHSIPKTLKIAVCLYSGPRLLDFILPAVLVPKNDGKTDMQPGHCTSYKHPLLSQPFNTDSQDANKLISHC